MNWLKILIALAAITIAGSAAFFSVTGLGVLFSGASLSVMIMAASLEYAKLVTATYLKQKWDSIKGFNKWYLTFSVIILMVITSAGIFGFLSNAFQQQSLKLDQVEREISVWDIKIKSNNDQIASLTTQLTALQSNQGTILEKGKLNNRLLRSVDNRDKQASKISDKISLLQDDNIKFNEEINNIKNKNIDLEKEVGGFRFVAEAFGVELKSVVKFFIFLIVIVFDPLAIALIIAFNSLVITKKEEEVLVTNEVKAETPKNEDITTIDANVLVSEISKLRLSEDDLKKLEEHLLNPLPPNEALKEAANQYNAMVTQKEEIKTEEQLPEPNIEVITALSDEEVVDMVMDEWERKLDFQEDEIFETPEDEIIIDENESVRQEVLSNMTQSNQEPSLYNPPLENQIQDQYDDELWGDDEVEEVLNTLPAHKSKIEEFSTIEVQPKEEQQIFSTIEPKDENFFQDNIVESTAPQTASEMMLTSDLDVISSIPQDDEVSDMDLPIETEPIKDIIENTSSEENTDDEKKKI